MKKIILGLSLFAALTPSAAWAVGPGMYLCLNPIGAASFDAGVAEVTAQGVTVTTEAGRQIATKNGCDWATGTDIEPVAVSPDGRFLKLSNEKVSGWASTFYYVFYKTQN